MLRVNAVSFAVLALFVAACPSTTPGETHVDSETHFLRACDGSCPEGLQCICGVCSVTCSPASDCSAFHEGASCVAADNFVPSSMCGSEAEPSVCDVACETDTDCGSLGDDHTCSDGRCRAAQVPANGCLYYGEPHSVGDSFESHDGCNTCRCEQAGEISCTARACVGDCMYDGRSYTEGQSFPADDGCNTCSCEAGGQVLCTERACADSCEYSGERYFAGEQFPASDGCNTCECQASGEVSCTEEGCNVCDLPFDAGPCEAAIPVYWHNIDTGLCEMRSYGGCEGNGNRFTELEQCATTCSGAQNGPTDQGASCRIGGEDYAHGDEIPSPYDDCNVCVCYDGQVISCTTDDCAGNACPAGTEYATGCAQCGIAGGCDIFETGCFARCSDGACTPDSICSDGVCLPVCL